MQAAQRSHPWVWRRGPYVHVVPSRSLRAMSLRGARRTSPAFVRFPPSANKTAAPRPGRHRQAATQAASLSRSGGTVEHVLLGRVAEHAQLGGGGLRSGYGGWMVDGGWWVVGGGWWVVGTAW